MTLTIKLDWYFEQPTKDEQADLLNKISSQILAGYTSGEGWEIKTN